MTHKDRSLIDSICYQYRDEEMILLESQLPGHPSSGASYIAVKPLSKIQCYGKRIEQVSEGNKKVFEMNPWDALKHFRKHQQGWLFGFIGYDMKNYVENLTSSNEELISIPDLYFMQPRILLKIENGEVHDLIGMRKQSSQQFHHNAAFKSFEKMTISPLITKSDYTRKIYEIQERIKEGLFYELNYSYPITGTVSADPFFLYREMRSINPVPFGAFLKLKDIEVCCSSPERFLKKTGRNIISEPIKGTAKRGNGLEEDQIRIHELTNEKNKAENLMIVDLVRHDLSKIAKTGSVQVTKLFDVQSFGTVHQLISSVQAVIQDDIQAVDVIRNCFPMGSMTGAPKIEVMKNIDQLEIYKRGLYSGAIGYITPEHDFDFNVVIRTALISGGRFIYPVGGAITSDSDPDNEWEETIVKAKNLTDVFSANVHETK